MRNTSRSRFTWLGLIAAILSSFALASCMGTGSEPRAVGVTVGTASENVDPSTGTVVFAVGWGRQWGCGSYENAQLEELGFSKLGGGAFDAGKPADILAKAPRFSTGSHIVENLVFTVAPGQYAFDRFRIKVARSVSDVGRVSVGPEDLFKDGQPIGGTFSVSGGEVVYIGHFGIDCEIEPIPWRFYIDGRDDYAKYVAELSDEHPALRGREVKFRPLNTRNFGGP